MENMIIEDIIRHIKEKKELNLLDDGYVRSIIDRELAKNRKLERLFDSFSRFEQLKKNKEYDIFFKEIRRKLRKAHGLFKSKDEYLSNYERDYAEFNGFLLKEIKAFKAKNIIDLGAGLNPIFISEDVYDIIDSYHAYEIDRSLIEKLEQSKKSGKLKPGYLNLLELKLPDELQKERKERNMILMLKVLEALEVFKKDFSEKLISFLKQSFPDSAMIVSFAKISSGGSQKIQKSGRSWFRRILGRLKKQGAIKDIRIEDIGNEIVFIIS